MMINGFLDKIRDDLARLNAVTALPASRRAVARRRWICAPRSSAAAPICPSASSPTTSWPRRLDTSDEWIAPAHRHRRAPRRRRRRADLRPRAARRAQQALDGAGMSGSDLDLIVLATATPGQHLPGDRDQGAGRGSACTRGAAFDVQAVCAGLHLCAGDRRQFHSGSARRSTALVIGAETFSRILDWDDRGTCVLFGDGAGAVVLSGGARAAAARPRHPVDPSPFRRAPATTSSMSMAARRRPARTGHLRMEGREVFRHAVQHLAEVVDEALAANGLTARAISTGWCRIRPTAGSSTASGSKLGLAADKVVVTIDRHANTSAASIPLALAEAVADGPDPARPSRADGSAWAAG